MIQNLRSLLMACVVTCGASFAFAGDWPQFRGPTGDGIAQAKNLPLTWSPTENIAWKTAIPGRGRSSPVILGDRIFLTTAVETNMRRYNEGPDGVQQAERAVIGAVCLDRTTGKLIYHVDLLPLEKPGRINSLNTYATPTPVVEPGRLYCDFGVFGTVCVDSATGKILWQRSLPVDHHHGSGSSAIVYKNLLILVRDGRDEQYVIALDTKTGETVWKTNRPPLRTPNAEFRKSFSTPLVFEAAGRTQMVVPGAQWLVSYDPETGKELWRADDGNGETAVPRPIFGNGMVYVTTGVLGSARPQLWAIRPDGQGDVTKTHVAWKLATQVPMVSSPVLVGRELYMVSDDGVVVCVDAPSGEALNKHRAGGSHYASATFADGRLYFFNRDGKATILQAGKDLKPLAENQLDGPLFASPAFVESAMYIRTDTHLYCVQQQR